MTNVYHSTLSGTDLHVPKAHAASHAAGGADAVTLLAAAISDFAESVDDRVAALLLAGTGITLTYNDAANTLTVAASGGGGGGGGTDPDVFLTCANATGLTIPKGTPVWTVGGAGSPVVPSITPADDYANEGVLGLAAVDIPDSTSGLVQVAGTLAGVDTSAWGAGDFLWVNSSGALVNAQPGREPLRIVGFVVTVNATTGSIHVLPQRLSPVPHTHADDADGGGIRAFRLEELGAVGSPPSGHQVLWINSADHKLYRRDSAGVDTLIG